MATTYAPLNQTAEYYRQQAADCRKRSADSYDSCDTDGFMSQWANDSMARQHEMEADIVEGGGTWEFPALFDLDGNLVAAKYFEGTYGWCWGVLSDDDPDGRFVSYFNPSQAIKPAVERRNNAKKGYYIGTVKAPARVKLSGTLTLSPVPYRIDGGFSRDVQIVDNGQEKVSS